ncbi:Acg family FMN-binding oxidoreductase [Streptomyces tropicalis]|uniref:Nitroreductase family protein n=1 Tax=Streptomyces tropicalis TaxID=3034234 RepID=A0ABT6A3V0_9ACTN|nr:nitroreductase family protein [Streptomyces tropicalis]MDF3299133.1 nitroreductase family protein [Streptomyces tropicalis]
MSVAGPRPSHATTYLLRAAVTAPSVHRSRPWIFVADGDRGIELHAAADPRLLLAGPLGRELVIGCAAALFNVRLAMRHLGFRPAVQPFPDPRDPAFLARIGWGAYAPPTADEQRLYAAVRRRHTVRGPFLADPLPPPLVDTLREQAHGEGAGLHLVDDSTSRRHLGELVRAGEDEHRTAPAAAAPDPWAARRPARGTATAVVGVLPPAPAGGDYAGLTRMFPTPPRRWPARTGLVAVLGTDRDDRTAWLRAGQALERIVLAAAVHDVATAFHTQPLELPHLREQMRQTLSAGEFPQLILRLGYGARPGSAVTP